MSSGEYDAYRCQVGEEGDDSKRKSVHESDESKPDETNQPFAGNGTAGHRHVTPDLE
jgi:hypothetical protein